MIENMTTIKSYLHNVKMETIWDLMKPDSKLTEAEKAQKREAIQKKIEDIKMKLKSGKRLSESEMNFLKKHAPDLYKKAQVAEAERQSYKQAIKSCKTKDDVQKVFLEKMRQSLSVSDMDQEMAEYMSAAVQQEHIKFTKSDDYKKMKWKSQQRIETGYPRQYQSESIDHLYEQALQIMEEEIFETKEFETKETFEFKMTKEGNKIEKKA